MYTAAPYANTQQTHKQLKAWKKKQINSRVISPFSSSLFMCVYAVILGLLFSVSPLFRARPQAETKQMQKA